MVVYIEYRICHEERVVYCYLELNFHGIQLQWYLATMVSRFLQWYPASWIRIFTLLQVVTPVVASVGSRDRVVKHYMKFVKEADISLGEIDQNCNENAQPLCLLHWLACSASTATADQRVGHFNSRTKHKAVVIRVHRRATCCSSMLQSKGHALLVSQMEAILAQQRQRTRYFDADVAIGITEVLKTLSEVERMCNPCSLYRVPGASTTDKRKQTLACDRIVYRRVKA